MTFSLVARCAETGMFGIAISSSSPAVAARCAHLRASVGAVASQNVTDPRLGPITLDHLAAGLSAQEALQKTSEGRAFMEYRQLLVVDREGQSAIHSGGQVLGIWGEARADNVAAGGNLLANDRVPDAIVEGFLAARGHLGDRLIAAMQAGLAAGGEAGPVHSAGLKIVDHEDFAIADLRVDWSETCPIRALSDLWALYKPQIDAYVQRALNPGLAPSYGVAGETRQGPETR